MRRDKRRGPLSADQQQLVRDNLGLVGVHLNRRLPGVAKSQRHRERADLHQEGCLGLMRAAQDYDPSSGIPFAAYALRRIQRAVAYALTHSFTLIRAPAFELRRAAAQPRACCGSLSSAENAHQPRDVQADPADLITQDDPTVAERLREKYLRALSDAAQAASGEPSRDGAAHRAVVRAIVAERLAISSAGWRRPLRKIARELGCGYATAKACERRLMKEVERRLRRDGGIAPLLRCAAASALGWRLPIDAAVEGQLRDASAAEFMRLLAESDDRARSEILRKLLALAGEALHPAICRSLGSLPDDLRDDLLAEARESAAACRTVRRHQQSVRRCA